MTMGFDGCPVDAWLLLFKVVLLLLLFRIVETSSSSSFWLLPMGLYPLLFKFDGDPVVVVCSIDVELERLGAEELLDVLVPTGIVAIGVVFSEVSSSCKFSAPPVALEANAPETAIEHANANNARCEIFKIIEIPFSKIGIKLSC
jgi:hypothetical protein